LFSLRPPAHSPFLLFRFRFPPPPFPRKHVLSFGHPSLVLRMFEATRFFPFLFDISRATVFGQPDPFIPGSPSFPPLIWPLLPTSRFLSFTAGMSKFSHFHLLIFCPPAFFSFPGHVSTSEGGYFPQDFLYSPAFFSFCFVFSKLRFRRSLHFVKGPFLGLYFPFSGPFFFQKFYFIPVVFPCSINSVAGPFLDPTPPKTFSAFVGYLASTYIPPPPVF